MGGSCLSACHLGNNLELSLGSGRINAIDQHNDYAVIQGKTLIKTLDTNSWGLGFSADAQLTSGQSDSTVWSANIPLRVSLLDDTLLLHANTGWTRSQAVHLSSTTWGIGSELTVNPVFSLVGEIYGNDRTRPMYATGCRYMLYKDYVEFNASYGNQFSAHHDSGFFSTGLVITTDQFLP